VSKRGCPLQTKKHRLFNHFPVLQVLYDNAFEQLRCDTRIPNALGIHDNDRTTGADAEAGGFTALDSIRTEEQILSIQKRRKL